jgi:hypothetical protein
MTKISKTKIPVKVRDVKANDKDYPIYPESDDIYSRLKESDVDPDDISKVKIIDDDSEETDDEYIDDESGRDLDIPGSEFDDDQEDYGNEDEENNYYSLGGDDHNDLDEDHDDM